MRTGTDLVAPAATRRRATGRASPRCAGIGRSSRGADRRPAAKARGEGDARTGARSARSGQRPDVAGQSAFVRVVSRPMFRLDGRLPSSPALLRASGRRRRRCSLVPGRTLGGSGGPTSLRRDGHCGSRAGRAVAVAGRRAQHARGAWAVPDRGRALRGRRHRARECGDRRAVPSEELDRAAARAVSSTSTWTACSARSPAILHLRARGGGRLLVNELRRGSRQSGGESTTHDRAPGRPASRAWCGAWRSSVRARPMHRQRRSRRRAIATPQALEPRPQLARPAMAPRGRPARLGVRPAPSRARPLPRSDEASTCTGRRSVASGHVCGALETAAGRHRREPRRARCAWSPCRRSPRRWRARASTPSMPWPAAT